MTAAAGNPTDVSPNRSSDASPNPDANGPNFEVSFIGKIFFVEGDIATVLLLKNPVYFFYIWFTKFI